MTELEYQQWWQYHIRVARGESLREKEAAIYHAGIEELDREEAIALQSTSPATLRQLRSQIHLTTLRLNPPQLVRSRLSRQLQQMLQEKYHLLEAQMEELYRTVAAQEQYLALLQAQIDQLRSAQ